MFAASGWFVRRFSKIAQATSIGFAIMGFIGFFARSSSSSRLATSSSAWAKREPPLRCDGERACTDDDGRRGSLPRAPVDVWSTARAAAERVPGHAALLERRACPSRAVPDGERRHEAAPVLRVPEHAAQWPAAAPPSTSAYRDDLENLRSSPASDRISAHLRHLAASPLCTAVGRPGP